MEIERQKLLDALQFVKPGLSSKEMIEQSTSFAFKEGRIMTYNDEISVSHPLPEFDIEGAVKAEEFYALIDKTNKDKIEIELTDAEVLVKCGRIKAGLVLQNEFKLPIDEIGEVGDWKVLPDGFLDKLRFTVFSCSKDMSMPVLTCVHVDTENSVMESCDNFRATKMTFGALGVNPFLIPSSSASILTGYKVREVAEGDGWIHFRNEQNTIFSCRVFEDNFVNTKPLYKIDGDKLRLPSGIQELLERSKVMAKRDTMLDEVVQVILKKDKITIKSQGDYGWIEESDKIKYTGEGVTFYINPTFLAEICNLLRNCYISENKLKFVGEDWEHVVILLSED
jgi:DNA polymerase III sliding clamp (beta) subunit (PCNA family)